MGTMGGTTAGVDQQRTVEAVRLLQAIFAAQKFLPSEFQHRQVRSTARVEGAVGPDLLPALQDELVVPHRDDAGAEPILIRPKRLPHLLRSEERRVGKEGVSPCRSRGSPYH